MQNSNSQKSFQHKILFITFIAALSALSSCYKIPQITKEDIKAYKAQKFNVRDLDFIVENTTGRTVYVACFYYAQISTGVRWGWRKSKIYKIKNDQLRTIDINFTPKQEDVNNIYAYLGVFEDQDDAEESIYELLDEDNKIDLDRLIKLKNKKIILGLEKYGVEGDYLYFYIQPLNGTKQKTTSLNFPLTNKTGQDLYIVLFSYLREFGQPQWAFDKDEILYVKNGETVTIELDTYASDYDRKAIRGYLGLFQKDKKQDAEDSTFETLKPANKVNLGILDKIHQQKIILMPKRYGLLTGFEDDYPVIEYTIKTEKK